MTWLLWLLVAALFVGYVILDRTFLEKRIPRCPHCKRRYY